MRTGFFPDFIDGVITPKASSCLPQPLAWCVFPEQSSMGALRGVLRKAASIFIRITNVHHTLGEFFCCSCFLLAACFSCWSLIIPEGFGHDSVAVQRSLRIFLWVLTGFWVLLPVCLLWVFLCCETGISSLQPMNFLR